MLRRSKNISLVMLAAVAAAACNENPQASNEEIKHCVDENGVVQDESKCADVPAHSLPDGGHPRSSGGHFWYYGGTRAPVSPGGRVTGGSYRPSPGRTYSPPSRVGTPSIGRGGFGGTGAGHAGGGGGGS